MTIVWVISAAGAVLLFWAIIHKERAYHAACRADRARFERTIAAHEREP